MLILQCVLSLVVYSVPLWVGFAFNRKTWSEAYLYGQVFLWACFQLIAVPMIHLRLPFSALWISYTGLMTVLMIIGFRKTRKPLLKPQKPLARYIPLILAYIIIAAQMIMYIFGMNLDADDSRWLAEASDALTKNRMLLYNPATGEYIGRFIGEIQKDVFSPWSMYIAVLSRITFVPVTVIAHTVYAPVLLLLAYLVYDQIGKKLFTGITARGLFLLMVSLIFLFMAGNNLTQAIFTLTRIWQGKAGVAAVMVPLFLLLLLQIEHTDTRADWLWLTAAGCACCLFSGLGIAISLILIIVYGLYAVFCKRFRRIPYLVLAILPPLLFGLFYLQMKG